MSDARKLARGHKQLLPLIEYALSEDWRVYRTAGGRLKFVKSGLPPIFTSSTASDHRAGSNARAMLQRTERQFVPGVLSEEEGDERA